ncbi:Mitochondrial substrate carrier family protein [Musa troglodytarum]|uniref:Mitochondrial substrate carrier family protein n=1 Tax=Musa troglodytarum TaxID=320322 RepID=A0A9E7EA58_9LILI|nr:Mitochondrial substrate carrier family protein [Musa troglodytarum]
MEKPVPSSPSLATFDSCPNSYSVNDAHEFILKKCAFLFLLVARNLVRFSEHAVLVIPPAIFSAVGCDVALTLLISTGGGRKKEGRSEQKEGDPEFSEQKKSAPLYTTCTEEEEDKRWGLHRQHVFLPVIHLSPRFIAQRGFMASEDVVGKSTGESAVTTIVNLAEEAKLAREGVKAPGYAVVSICKSLVAGGVAGGVKNTGLATALAAYLDPLLLFLGVEPRRPELVEPAPRAPGSGARRRKARETWMDRVATTCAMASTSQNYRHIRRARDLSLISACDRMYETWSDAF